MTKRAILKTGSAWERLVTHLHFPPTREGFTAAWTQACGHPPDTAQVDAFMATVTQSLGLVKPTPVPNIVQPGFWPDKETR